MDLKTRVYSFLSRKFLAPIIAVLLFIVWVQWLQAIPVGAYAVVVGGLCALFSGLEGIKDIIIAVSEVYKKNQ